MSKTRYASILVSLAMTLPAAAAAAGASSATEPVFNHFDVNRNQSYRVRPAAREYFVVEIVDTCPGSFSYEYIGVERAEQKETEEPRKGVATQDLSSGTTKPITLEKYLTTKEGYCIIRQGNDRSKKVLKIPHEAKFDGYLVEIKPTGAQAKVKAARAASDVFDQKASEAEWRKSWRSKVSTAELEAVTLVITVDERGWEYEIAGGFGISALTDDEFALVNRKLTPPGQTDEQELKLVIREPDKEDEYRLGLAAFIHLYHSRLDWLAGSFGLGINESTELNYFLGMSWRMGGRGYLTAGVNWGPVARLPSGTQRSPDPSAPGFDLASDFARLHPVTDDNVLNNLGTRTDHAFFIALSYSFLSPGEGIFKKGFASTDDTSPAPKAPAPPQTPPEAPGAPPPAPDAPPAAPDAPLEAAAEVELRFEFAGQQISDLDFGEVPLAGFVEKVLTIMNLGTKPARITGMLIEGGAFGRVSRSDACSDQELKTTGTCEITVRFAPTEAQPYNGTITVFVGDTGAVLPLEGKGTPPTS